MADRKSHLRLVGIIASAVVAVSALLGLLLGSAGTVRMVAYAVMLLSGLVNLALLLWRARR